MSRAVLGKGIGAIFSNGENLENDKSNKKEKIAQENHRQAIDKALSNKKIIPNNDSSANKTIRKEVTKEVTNETKVKLENNHDSLMQTGYILVPIDKIRPNSLQPRRTFDENLLRELADSIKENGIIQPITVQYDQEKKIYEIIAGERRFRASKLAGLDRVPVIIKNVTNKDKLVLAIIENVQRSDLNCVEEALSYYRLMQEFKLTQEQVAKEVGKERSSIANILRILTLPKSTMDYLQKGTISLGHAKVLLGIKEKDRISSITELLVRESWSVRQLESFINRPLEVKKENVPVDRDSIKKAEQIKSSLEKKTGFHFNVQRSEKGQGKISVIFQNDAEFNDIYNFMMKS